MRKFASVYNQRNGEWTIICKDDHDVNWSVYLESAPRSNVQEIVDALNEKAQSYEKP